MDDLMFLQMIFDHLLQGDASVIISDNTKKLNEIGLRIYYNSQNQLLVQNEQEELKILLMICNILYNRTDLSILPIDDGFYDLLNELYKNYNPNFQVGSAVVTFKQNMEINSPTKQEVIRPVVFIDNSRSRNEIENIVYDTIMRVDQPIMNRYDFSTIPVEFDQSYISKRMHNTEHNHPDLVGTLDKAKFICNKDAIDAGVFNDANVKVLERDFFQDHINKGIISPHQQLSVIAELKYDGISVEADCNFEVVSARTRGDTGIGVASDISPILKGYVFKQARCMIGEKPIGVKFEAIMTKSNLSIFNQLRGKNYSNCRTAIQGLFGASDGYKFRDLITLVPLALDRNDIPGISNRIEEVEFLNRVFVSNGEPLRYCIFTGTLSEILYQIKVFCNEALFARDFLDFMYDGIVISYLDEDIRAKLGRKNYINKYSMAVKFNPLERKTIFRGYTYEIGQHGQITPMIHYDPVEFIGTIHTKSTGSSYERFRKLNLRLGDYITVTYVNDVMPYVTNCDCEYNKQNEKIQEPVPFISNCPVCGSKLVLSDSGKTVICPNRDCSARALGRMTNMLAKMNIKGFSEATIASLGVSHLYELFQISKEEMINKIGVADGTTFYSILQLLLSGTPISSSIIMGALGFTSIAHKKWQSILEHISLIELYDLYKTGKENFKVVLSNRVPNIGTITCNTIVEEFPFFEKDIEFILCNLNIQDPVKPSKMQIRFTGFRNKQLSELLCNAGYDADDNSAVTKRTSILLVPYEGFTSSKVSKASSECKIVGYDNFISNMENYIDPNDAKAIKSNFS